MTPTGSGSPIFNNVRPASRSLAAFLHPRLRTGLAVAWTLTLTVTFCLSRAPAFAQDAIGASAPMAPPSEQPDLSAAQIVRIVQQSPSLTAELKTQMADALQQAGTPVDPADISDAMLVQQISTNSSLRAAITRVLRARGIAPADETSPAEPSAAPGSAPAEGAIGPRPDPFSVGNHAQPLDFGLEFPSSGSDLRQRRAKQTHASTDLPRVRHLPTPYDLPSLRDLYSQIANAPLHLRRFGSDMFETRNFLAAMRGLSDRNAPLSPNYVVGPGDTLSIDLWGGVTQTLVRTVGRDGRILLPEAGSVAVAGLTLERIQGVIGGVLRQQFRNAQVAVTLTRLRSVRIYVVGDVRQPGAYDVSALATPLSALYLAGGPTAVGSLRTLLLYRGQRVIESIDLYDFLLHGMRAAGVPMESGDTLLVPPAGPQAAIYGAVKRPAIYELNAGKTTLATLIADAGGLTAAAAPGQIRIERINARHQRVTVSGAAGSLTGPGASMNAFPVEDGDRIRVEPILPYSQQAIYLVGHVARPGRLPYRAGLRLGDVIRSYRDLLPEPADHGEIIRLVPPDLHPAVLDFNLPSLFDGGADPPLHPFDTIRIFGRYDQDPPRVQILGEVMRPGSYAMPRGMTAADLVRLAGGFKRDALRVSADLTSYALVQGERAVEVVKTVRIGAALSGADPRADVRLKPGDVLMIHQITNWDDIGESVTIQGQVRYPGTYGFQDGERLSSVLRRAGGMLPTAYPRGAVFTRQQVRELQQKSREELIREIDTSSAAARLTPGLTGGSAGEMLQLIQAQQNQVLADLKSRPPTGRMVIHIGADIDRWANTSADIEVRRGDVLTIPKRPGFVLITGQVFNPTALTFVPGKSAGWYLRRAGGSNSTADRKEIFVIRANGAVVGRGSGGWLGGGVLATKLNPGDVVVVPRKIIGGSAFWRNLLSTGQLAASIAISARVAAAAL